MDAAIYARTDATLSPMLVTPAGFSSISYAMQDNRPTNELVPLWLADHEASPRVVVGLDPHIQLKGQIAPDLIISGHLWVTLKSDETGVVIAMDRRLNLYGAGGTVDEAVGEFVSMLVDLYEELESSEDILSNYLREQLEYLRSILRRT